MTTNRFEPTREGAREPEPESTRGATRGDSTADRFTRHNRTVEKSMTARFDLPDAAWRPISAKYIAAEFVGVAVTLVIFTAATIPLHLFGWDLAWAATGAAAGVVLLMAAFVPRRVRAIGYQLRDDDLVFRRGIMFQRIVAVPYGRMQLIDINRGPLTRALGLSELRFVTAAAATAVVIPGLPELDAEQLRDRLVGLAESRRAGL